MFNIKIPFNWRPSQYWNTWGASSYQLYFYLIPENMKTIKFLSVRRTDKPNILSVRPIFYRSCIKSMLNNRHFLSVSRTDKFSVATWYFFKSIILFFENRPNYTFFILLYFFLCFFLFSYFFILFFLKSVIWYFFAKKKYSRLRRSHKYIWA